MQQTFTYFLYIFLPLVDQGYLGQVNKHFSTRHIHNKEKHFQPHIKHYITLHLKGVADEQQQDGMDLNLAYKIIYCLSQKKSKPQIYFESIICVSSLN